MTIGQRRLLFEVSTEPLNRQIGTTIDGVANGNSGYGGGKAGRFADTDIVTDALTGLSFDPWPKTQQTRHPEQHAWQRRTLGFSEQLA